ncbi:DUF6493 family protein [Streptomyces ipomoeae]|uniref:DUF7824 domain-containing protein n=1 Tax=Streptomyces ipomoeae 91-03 TaxID=698759 RepID=L1KR86_9ACTN|nr:DUF6493 family protein [Streptomyces ipomoeae]EKX63079.1 hypothetical protein STRIP9103_01260 [Streptomyces ipomoeae 91-03]TQE21626.1 hypothetical protein Sipo7851_40325 [Streptomyces ipomoeae]
MTSEALITAVRAGNPSDVLALVDGMTDAERRACMPELKELRKKLRPEPWSSPAQRAYPALQAAGAACQTGAAAVATWLTGSDMRWRHASPAVLLVVLGDRDPDWLADLVHRLAERPLTAEVPYKLMAGLVGLAGCAVPTSEAYVWGWMQHISRYRRNRGTVVGNLRKDPHLRELVAALFETEEIGARSDWRYDEGPNNWTNALTQLTQEGLLDRKVMIDACVARLLRGGSTADNKVFLGLLTALDLTPDERRERVADWTALCADAPSTVASHAQSVLTEFALNGELGARRLAEVSGAVLFRPERKLVRTQLILLGKALKQDPSGAAELLPVVAQAFGHEDTDVQERALKLVERHIGELPDGSAVRDELADAAAGLSPALRARALELLGAAALEHTNEVYEELLPPVPLPTRLAPTPETVAELAEEAGAVLAGDSAVGAFERALDGLVRHAHRDREALVEALGPTVSRCWWADLEADSLDRYFRESPYGLDIVLVTLLERVSTSALHPARNGAAESAGCVHSGVAWAFDARLWEIAYRIRTEPLPFLLATPTWSTGALEAAELVARLDEYRRLGVRAGEKDFAQALLRVRRDDRAALSAAAVAARELGTAEGDRLAEWLLTDIPPLPVQWSHTDEPRMLVEFGELPELQGELFPPEFRRLGRPLTPYESRWYCRHWDDSEWRHWLAVVPGRPELLAGRILRDLSQAAIEDTRAGFSFLPTLAEAEGEAGEAVRLCVTYGLGAQRPEDRLAAVDALLVLAARGQLDAEALGTDLGRLAAFGSLKPLRVAEAIRTAATTGAYGTAWAVLRAMLPRLLAELAGEDKAGKARTPIRGLGELVAVAAECVERSGAHGELPHLDLAADRRGSSRLVTEARRLRTALAAGGPVGQAVGAG